MEIHGAFDLTIIGWLLWRRTRLLAWLAVVVFHVLTWRLFAIGVFPWVMIAATTVFFDPSWPSRLLRRVTGGDRHVAHPSAGARGSAGRPDGGPPALGWIAVTVVWAALQVAVPLRHLAYAGDVRWADEGHYGSSRVMLTRSPGCSISPAGA